MAKENNNAGCTISGLVGCVAAVCVSWVFNHSVGWAIFHFFCGWLYLGYKAIWYVVTHY